MLHEPRWGNLGPKSASIDEIRRRSEVLVLKESLPGAPKKSMSSPSFDFCTKWTRPAKINDNIVNALEFISTCKSLLYKL